MQNIETGHGFMQRKEYEKIIIDPKTNIKFPDVSMYYGYIKSDHMDINHFTKFIKKLAKIYPNKCFQVSSNNLDYFIIINFKNLKYIVPNQLKINIENCSNKKTRYIFIPINLQFTTGGHSNLVIIDTFIRQIYFFEPHGKEFMNNISNYINIEEKVLLIIQVTFPEFINYNISNLFDNCRIGPQTKQSESSTFLKSGGYCLSWSLLIIHLTILNQHKSINEIIDFLKNLTAYRLDKYIKYYTNYIYSIKDINESNHNTFINHQFTILLTHEEISKIKNSIYHCVYNYNCDDYNILFHPLFQEMYFQILDEKYNNNNNINTNQNSTQ